MNERETDKSAKLPGVYRHKVTGVEVTLKTQPKLGTPLINAYIRSGFEYVGPKPVKDVSEVVSDTTESGAVDVVEGDKFTETKTKNGTIQYRKNGKLISKEEYENK